MSDQADAVMELDVREMTPRDRHPRNFADIDSLEPGTSLLLINDHDPKPLHYQLMAEREGQIGWTYIESGPEVWKVRITRLG